MIKEREKMNTVYRHELMSYLKQELGPVKRSGIVRDANKESLCFDCGEYIIPGQRFCNLAWEKHPKANGLHAHEEGTCHQVFYWLKTTELGVVIDSLADKYQPCQVCGRPGVERRAVNSAVFNDPILIVKYVCGECV